ncbi:MAG: hypothetical protein AMXMBFR33_50580 [Candidatus Xenobia bacterium]
MLFYAHVLLGLGHVSRALAIAEAAARAGARCALLASGLVEGLTPRGAVELVKLPSAVQRENLAERRALVQRTIASWDPDCVLVDHLPLGLEGELVDSLLAHDRVRFVWGLPYASPGTRPRNPRLRAALARYQAALAYTDPGWCDPFESGLELLPAQRDYCGVIARPPEDPGPPSEPPLVVALAGAGAGGAELFDWLRDSLRGRARLRVVLGPLSDARLVSSADLEVLSEGAAEQSLRGASLVVARAGYNTAYTLARSSLPVILAPLDTPQSGAEQLERAEALARLSGIWCLRRLDPAVLDEALAWRGRRELPFRVDGAERAARFLLEAAL